LRHVALQEAICQGLQIRHIGRREGLARLLGCFRQHAGIDFFQDPRQRHAPALVAPPCRGVERRTMGELRLGDRRWPRQGARRQTHECFLLGGDQSRDHPQKVFELVPRGQCL
jgi:hypothetical protein